MTKSYFRRFQSYYVPPDMHLHILLNLLKYYNCRKESKETTKTEKKELNAFKKKATEVCNSDHCKDGRINIKRKGWQERTS